VSAPAPESAGTIAEVTGLSFSYGSLTALSGVNLRIEPGATGLLGPNGAGKTTLIHVLLGLLRPTLGRVRLFGREQAGAARAETRTEVGYMPESESLIPGMTGVEMVSYLARLSGLPAADAMARAHEALYYVGLGEARYRAVADYSTGMRQRIKLAQALAHGPRLVILDEPTNGLDPHGREEILGLIVDLWKNKGLSVLLSSHVLPDVEATCRSVLVLDKGRLVATRQLLDASVPEPSAGETRTFEVRVKDRPEVLSRRLQERGITVRSGREGVLFVGLPSGAGTAVLFEEARREGLQLRHLVPVRASLEDIFVEAVGEGASA
jgi:ABC-2 type transport system ATP-binding protein